MEPEPRARVCARASASGGVTLPPGEVQVLQRGGFFLILLAAAILSLSLAHRPPWLHLMGPCKSETLLLFLLLILG